MVAPDEFPQHERLTRVLNIYRRAMRRHIAAQWRAKHSDSWFKELRTCLAEHQQEELERSRKSLELQRTEGAAPLSKEEEYESLLDIPMFLEAVKSRSDLFGKLADRQTTDRIAAVYRLRNKWAHPPLRDLNKAEVMGAAGDCASILGIFDPDSAHAVGEVMGADALTTAQLESLSGRLDQINAGVSHLLDHPSAAVQGMSDAVTGLQQEVQELKQTLGAERRAEAQAQAAAAQNVQKMHDRIAESQQSLKEYIRDSVLALTERAEQGERAIEAMRAETAKSINDAAAKQQLSQGDYLSAAKALELQLADIRKQLHRIAQAFNTADQAAALQAISREVSGLRSQLAASRTQLGDCYRAYEAALLQRCRRAADKLRQRPAFASMLWSRSRISTRSD